MEASQEVEQAGKGKLIAFRVLAVIGGLLGVSGVGFIVQSLVVEADKIHRVHDMTMQWVLIAMITVPLWTAVKNPEKVVAPFRVFLAVSLAMIVGGIMGGDLVGSGFLIMPALAAILLALHPARTAVWRCVKGSVALILLGVVELVPAVVYGIREGDLQKNPPLGMEEHAAQHHFSGMAYTIVALGLGVIAASFPGTKQRLAVWMVGTPAVAIGLTDLAYQGYVGSTNVMWAWALIFWGALVILVGEMEVRRAAGVPNSKGR